MIADNPAADSLIDHKALLEMHAAIGREAIIEVGLELAQSLRDTARGLAGKPQELLGDLAHALKGSTAYLGTRALHDLAVAADLAAKQGRDPRPILEQLISLIEPSLRRLEEAVLELPEDEV